MRKTARIVVLVLALLCIYLVGFKQGEQAVLSNQVITSELQEEGFYTSNYEGKENLYWYE